MPSSTPWRRRQSDSFISISSPDRPSDDSIERLSPAPFLSSYTSNHNTTRSHTREHHLFGLGLSSSSQTDGRAPVEQPDHLYIDQDGGAHVGGKARGAKKSPHAMNHYRKDAGSGEARKSKTSSRQSRLKNHTRSGSTIDDLASIAIATSPTFDGESPTFLSNSKVFSLSGSRPATSHTTSYNHDIRSWERPAKRVRSEKLHAMEWSPRDERPRTSHALQPQTSMEDAELLLGLRNGYSFSTNTSPVFAAVTPFHALTALELITPPILEPLTHATDPSGVDEANDMSVDAKEEIPTTDRPMQDAAHVEIQMLETKPQSEQVQGSEFASAKDHKPADSINNTQMGLDVAENISQHAPQNTKEPRTVPTKKPRKVKPEVQAEVCAACQRLQREPVNEDETTQWICCDYCAKWFHLACGGFKDKAETRAVDKFVCKDCEPQHGQTTFVRKSSRVRTAIDYAGLNQGVVKTSEESPLHHYIQPLKDRTIKYLSDDFARVRPELLTAEFWENMDNMKRPFVVPACWNPRFGVSTGLREHTLDTSEKQADLDPSDVLYDAHGNLVKQSQFIVKPAEDPEPDKTTEELAMDCDQDYLDMVMPRNLTVRRVAELYGPEQPVPVIDVKSQETKGQWTLSQWADYYEQRGDKPIRNVISLEVSNSPIGKLIRRPKAVRDIDLEDYVWDNESRTANNKRPVQFYCLMSVADSYTDFHIDFGGSSVYYHILKGVKTFFFIPPEDKNLKEYEKWCNSDTQNETWLGDLCNGNVTRVDLHEGDTAFIPAGWIHSVWTPEDSLVVGGNFLTRLDYELQLKVMNVEKATKVPQKFRYPFFQKVMWYALLKYLEEDPVPEEVLRDFHSDEDYRYLRANPVWHEYGDLANDAEPGEPGHNARWYPKSEINGLPYLRDYLYRTACIHADIPVPDINKKQIDAVKASIPKGHGDPMRLIKTFAVWCAWKAGNEVVPRWVHDQGDGLSTELRERERAKEEVFRVPPERVSARNASKVKAVSPAVEVLTTPAKPAASVDANDGSSTKSRSGSRGGSLRVACDACRKRRIKCRHKEGDDAAANSSPPEIRPRTYSNVSVDIPKLASASPVSSAFDQASTANGAVQEFNATSDLAQAALATLHSQSSDSGQALTATSSNSPAKKGRSKACEECRKSKRRCVHDEYGRIDPAKAAEPSKPRGSSTSKRQSRLSDENPTKRHKFEDDIDPRLADYSASTDIDMMIDPALMGDGFPVDVVHAPTESIVRHGNPEVATNSSSQQSAPASDAEAAGSATPGVERDQPFNASPRMLLTSDNQLQVTVGEGASGVLSNLPPHMRHSPDIDISYSPITVDGNVVDSGEKADIKMEDIEMTVPGSRHSTRQPKQVDRYVAGDQYSPAKAETKAGRDSRASSISERTFDTSAKSRRSSSNTSGNTHQAAAMHEKPRPTQDVSARPVSRGSSADSDMDADEKFARELQAAENGLRRRASMKA